ncbi:unnamed protein product [Victoria cruziana]
MDGVVRRPSRGMLPFLALNVANEFYRLERKPPVTAGLLLANTLIYLRPGVLDALLPTIDEVWFNPHIIVKNRDLKRFFLSAFYHTGESHLVYNMLSLLWKGVQLEISMGSVDFASMVAALLVMSQGVTLALAKMLVLFDYGKAYYQEYAVGFSGVLFAMKVVLNSQSDDYTYVHGLIVPSRYAAWAELVLIQMFVPGVSFLGHLGGILAGMLYLHLKGGRVGSDPLTILLRKFIGVFSRPVRYIKDLLTGRRRRTFGRGSVGRRRDAVWRCPACTFDNAVSLRRCEMCDTPREGGAFPTTRDRSRELSADELRRRRLERFS